MVTEVKLVTIPCSKWSRWSHFYIENGHISHNFSVQNGHIGNNLGFKMVTLVTTFSVKNGYFGYNSQITIVTLSKETFSGNFPP